MTRFGPGAIDPYDDEARGVQRQALDEGQVLTDRVARPGVLGQAERLITAPYAVAVEKFLAANAIERTFPPGEVKITALICCISPTAPICAPS